MQTADELTAWVTELSENVAPAASSDPRHVSSPPLEKNATEPDASVAGAISEDPCPRCGAVGVEPRANGGCGACGFLYRDEQGG